MQKIIYTHTPSGQSWDYRLPKILRWNGVSTSNITEDNMGDFGIVKEVVEMPDPVPTEPILPEALVAKEQAFAAKLAQLATAFQIDLLSLPDINIGTMLQAAQQAGASESEIANASAILLALAKDVEAESGMVWADTWLALKSRLPGYLQEV
jgi:hypothetical protein